MKKNYSILFLFILSFFSYVLTSCHKENPGEESQHLETKDKILINDLLQKLPDWLDKHKTQISTNSTNNINLLKQNLDVNSTTIEKRNSSIGTENNNSIDLLKQNLDSSGTIVQKRNNGDNIIIIPIKKAYLATKNLNKNYISNLLIVQKNSGDIKWGSIVYFIRSDEKTQDALLPNTLQKIINNEQIEDDGVFNFFSVTDKLLYRLEYKNKKLYSWGRQTQNGNTGKIETTNGTIKVSETCTNWYLTTTYYYSDGSTTQTIEYLGRTCDGDAGSGGGGGGAGGGGGGGGPETRDPNDQIIVETGSDTSEETAYTDNDLDYTNAAGALNPPVPDYVRIAYIHYYEIDKSANTGLITNVQIYDTTLGNPTTWYTDYQGDIIRRSLVLLAQSSQAYNYGLSAKFVWGCQVNAQYYYQGGQQVWSRQWQHNREITRY